MKTIFAVLVAIAVSLFIGVKVGMQLPNKTATPEWKWQPHQPNQHINLMTSDIDSHYVYRNGQIYQVKSIEELQPIPRR